MKHFSLLKRYDFPGRAGLLETAGRSLTPFAVYPVRRQAEIYPRPVKQWAALSSAYKRKVNFLNYAMRRGNIARAN
jgi:hypothetical protein